MSDTPIYDQLRAEYMWRSINENLTDWQKQWMEAMQDTWRQVRETVDQASENVARYFVPMYVGGVAYGKVARAQMAIMDEVVEYDDAAWALADATGWPPADAQSYLDQFKDAWPTMKAIDWTMAAIKMPPKPPVWVMPNRPHKQLTHQRPQTRALGRTHYHGGRR